MTTACPGSRPVRGPSARAAEESDAKGVPLVRGLPFVGAFERTPGWGWQGVSGCRQRRGPDDRKFSRTPLRNAGSLEGREHALWGHRLLGEPDAGRIVDGGGDGGGERDERHLGDAARA